MELSSFSICSNKGDNCQNGVCDKTKTLFYLSQYATFSAIGSDCASYQVVTYHLPSSNLPFIN